MTTPRSPGTGGDRPADSALIGGHPVVDFLNTVHWRNSDDRRRDTLTSYPDALRGAGRIGLLPVEEELESMLEIASRDEKRSADALEDLVERRELVHRVFAAIAGDEDPARPDLEALGRAHADALAHATLVRRDDGFNWSWARSDLWRRPARLLIARATELLRSPDHERLKECDDDGCGWLFVDHSKNGSRRWCSMEICGSRSKMRAHYRRKKGAADRTKR